MGFMSAFEEGSILEAILKVSLHECKQNSLSVKCIADMRLYIDSARNHVYDKL